MKSLKTTRLVWLARRLSRIYPAEIPYRVHGVLRTKAQARGWFDARHPPSMTTNARYGSPWVRIPANEFVDLATVQDAARQPWVQGLSVFDIHIDFEGSTPNWNRDPKTGKVIDSTFGLDIDFRHIDGGVDIKYLWELNRHVWWVPIAQAFAVTREPHYLKTLGALLTSWLDACPYPQGANWSSPVEHGIRLINWSIVWHLIGGEASALFAGSDGKALLKRWLDSIYQHMRFARDNYSFYSSSDNHLIGEAAGIFVAAHTWDLWAESRVLRKAAKRILEEEIVKQFAPDGVNLEQALCYHKFSMEFLIAAQLCGMANDDDFSPTFHARMGSAATFMAAMMDCNGKVPAIGDSDDGRVFGFAGDGTHSAYEALLSAVAAVTAIPALTMKLDSLGSRDFVARQWLATPKKKATAGRLVNEQTTLPTCFEQGGYVLVGTALHTSEEIRIAMDVGPLGYNRIAGHGHADALAVLLSARGQEFLIDPGTYCYNAAPELRKYFRGTSSHNTVQIDGADQSIYGGSFLWLRDIATQMTTHSDDGQVITVEASHDGYMRLDDPVRHRRKLSFNRATLMLVIEDSFECIKQHRFAMHWHFSPDCRMVEGAGGWVASRAAGSLTLRTDAHGASLRLVTAQAEPPLGWISRKFYEKFPAHTLIVEGNFDHQTVVKTTLSFANSN